MKKPSKKNILWLLALLFFIGVLAFSLYRALGIYLPQKQAQEAYEQLKESATAEESETAERAFPYAALLAENSDFQGWLSVEDTVIDYPVMQSGADDPEYYLRRNFNGEPSTAGCLFIGGGCDIDSDCFIIYGHNMSTDIMFGTLDRYADPAYAADHTIVRLVTPEEDREYQVFAAFQSKIYNDTDQIFKYYDAVGSLAPEQYGETVENLRSLSVIDLAQAQQYPAQLLLLSTCSYHTTNGRFVVAAYRVK
ncbi:MAG: class B sortase [Eubacterium sp.]|nr:class B sortase [Eubacterium sp.]